MDRLAAVTGQIMGTSASPEMGLAVLAVVVAAKTTRSLLVATAVGAGFVVLLRALIIPNYSVRHALVATIALAVLVGVGWGIRLGALAITARLSASAHLRKGCFRLAVIVLVGWIAFVVWSNVEQYIDDQAHLISCSEVHRNSGNSGRLAACYDPLLNRQIEPVIEQMYPLHYFATRNVGIAAFPGFFLGAALLWWIARGFKRCPEIRTMQASDLGLSMRRTEASEDLREVSQ